MFSLKILLSSRYSAGELRFFVNSTFARYREAIGLHIDAFWKKNSLVLFGAGGVFVCLEDYVWNCKHICWSLRGHGQV